MEHQNGQTEIDINTANDASNQNITQNVSAVSDSYSNSQKQLQWTDRQVTSLERQLLLNNYQTSSVNIMSNWTKVFLCALSVFIPGLGQLIGIISGLVLVSNDSDSDKRTYGAALLTVSIIVFIIMLIFWFMFALAFSPVLNY